MKNMLILFVVASIVSGAHVVFAGDKKTSAIENMNFTDEKLVDPNLSPDGDKFVARDPVVRTTLVRPRTSFVAELLQTIEDL
jgi:hypothetical protein